MRLDQSESESDAVGALTQHRLRKSGWSRYQTRPRPDVNAAAAFFETDVRESPASPVGKLQLTGQLVHQYD